MDAVRFGKDFSVEWQIFRKTGDDGREPYNLTGADMKVYLKSAFISAEVVEYSVSGNVISFIFRGKDQKHLGVYTLLLVVNQGKDGMLTIDKQNAFSLVAHTDDESHNPNADVTISHVDLTSESVLLPVTVGGGEVDLSKFYTKDQSDGRYVQKGTLSKVAESGSYNDLEDKPTLPAPYDDTELRNAIKEKQDKITDLDAIRRGAEKGATALQEHQSLAGYATETYVGKAISAAITNELNGDF